MKHISVMLKPASSLCNMRCKYCFDADVSSLRDVASYGVMTEETAHSVLSNIFCDLEVGDALTLAFQGGEPTLAGLDFFRDFVREAGRLAAEGYKELVLTGIEISSWGQDFRDGSSPIDVIEAVCRAAPGCRVRLGSLEPRTITGDFCRRAAALPNLCPHFHLSLQSGCDATLKRMNRKYDTARYLESVELLRKWFGEPGITTDLIVGFPGETEEEFARTLDFLRTCAFTAMHIFPYSRRSGTPADRMPGQVPKSVKEDRARRAAAVAEALRQSYLRGWVGRTLPVLFEEEKNGLWRGHAPNYAEVFAPGQDLHNAERTVRVTGVQGDHLTGVLA